MYQCFISIATESLPNNQIVWLLPSACAPEGPPPAAAESRLALYKHVRAFLKKSWKFTQNISLLLVINSILENASPAIRIAVLAQSQLTCRALWILKRISEINCLKDWLSQYCPQITSWSPQGMESCGNARFRLRKYCPLLSNVKTFAPERNKWTRLLQCLNSPMFAVRLWITTYFYHWPIWSLPSTYLLCTPPALH
jgi:hypothetical protein